MKILIVSQYYYPEQFQINDIAPELVKRGHEVTVLTGLPNYPQGKIFDGYEGGKRREEIINGVKVLRCRISPRRRNPISLILNYLSFVISGNRAVKKISEQFDAVLCYQLSPVTMLSPAAKYAKKHKIPLLCYTLDIWPESAQGMLKTDKGPIYALIKRISKRLYHACDSICVTSSPFIEYFTDVIGIEKSKLSYIPQHADSSYLKMDMSSDDNGVVDFMYAGNMGKGQSLDVLVKAVEILKHRDNFIVHMVGDGSNKKDLEKMIEHLGISDKFIFYGNQKREDMPAFYKKADALLLTLRGNNFVGNTMPGKLQMYMTTGKPVFAAINGAAAEVISDADCGACVRAGDSEGLAKLMASYIDDMGRYSDAGENARKYFEKHFTLDIYMDRLEEQLNKEKREYGI